jgi:hypothetical protein
VALLASVDRAETVLTTDLSTAAGWVVNIAVAEYLIPRPARRRRVRRAS